MVSRFIEDTLVGEDEPENRGIFLASINVVLNVESANFVERWEPFNLP